MTKYFELNMVSDPEIKGVTSGLAQVELDEDNPTTRKLKDFFLGVGYWERGKTIPDFDINNCTATLLPKAKLTDFLDFSPFLITCDFMISEDVLTVFRKLKIQQYVTYPVQIYKRKKKPIAEKYYLFCCPLQGYDVINFQESVFYTGSEITGKKYVHYNNHVEYQSDNRITNVEKLVLNENFDSTLDLFTTRIGGIFVSEALKDAIEIIGFTGVRISNIRGPEIVVK
jgi:hypothetical protein